jgi:hypothetical protein
MSKKDLWEAISTAAREISSDEIQSLGSSMDRRHIFLLSNNGGYIKY